LDWGFEEAYRFFRAMDYCGMDIMPLPKVKLKEEVYFIEDYKLIDSYSIDPRNELCIFSKERNKFLYCSLKKCE
jgi:hypothetical protein